MHETFDYHTPPVQLSLDDLGLFSYHLGATTSLPLTMFRDKVFPTHLWHLCIQRKLKLTNCWKILYYLLRTAAIWPNPKRSRKIDKGLFLVQPGFFIFFFTLTKWINLTFKKTTATSNSYEMSFWYIPPHFHWPHTFIAPKPLKTIFKTIFLIESMLRNSVNFSFLAPAAKSHAG